MNKETKGNLLILIGGCFFGLIPIFTKLCPALGVAQLIFFRAFFGAISIYAITRLSGNKITYIHGAFKKILLWSIILLIAILCYFYALKTIDSTSAVLLLALSTPFTVLLSALMLKERINNKLILALFFSMLGTVFILYPAQSHHIGKVSGYVAAIIAAIFTSVNFVFKKKYLDNENSYNLTFFQTLWQVPFLLPLLFLEPMVFTLRAFLVLFGMGFFCSALAFLFIYKGSEKTEGKYIGILQTSETIFPIIVCITFFKETASSETLIGGIFLFISYILIFYGKKVKDLLVKEA